MDTKLDALWKRRGFDPRTPREEYYNCFTLLEAQTSLFGSTRFEPKAVYLSDRDSSVRMPIVIDLARPLFIDEDIGAGDKPDWYFEARVLESERCQARRIRIHVSKFGDDVVFVWQWIKHRA